ncbi:MAG: hypothetical protein M5U08_16970 [Burkholderiales bacterium]|nr:hypothetical protein [Burkholderiales bacterium]
MSTANLPLSAVHRSLPSAHFRHGSARAGRRLDEQARAYLPHMCRAANFILVDDVRRLPLRRACAYRRLTA